MTSTRPLLLLTRPVEEAGRTAAAAAEAGFDTLAAPLLEIHPLAFSVPAGPFDALLFTSARAPAIAAAQAPQLRALPAHSVGRRTAEEAQACGFRTGVVGEADGTALLAAVAAGGAQRLLHLAGAATAPLQVPAGLALARVPVYAARRVGALPEAAAAALRADAVFATLLFSARTARHFRELVADCGIAPGRLRLVALSAAVAEAAGAGWAGVAVAGQPDVAGALAAARRLWQGIADGG